MREESISLNQIPATEIFDKERAGIKPVNFWCTSSYGMLMNKQGLSRVLQRNIWSVELKSLLKDFSRDINQLHGDLKFKVSGKVLNSSTYVLKRKTHTLINNSLDTQEEIEEINDDPILAEEELDCDVDFEYDDECSDLSDGDYIFDNNNDDNYDSDDDEIFEAFAELEALNLLDEEQKKSFEEEKIKRVLSLDIAELDKKLKDKVKILNVLAPKPKFRRLNLKDLSDVIKDVLENGEQIVKKQKHSRKRELKGKLPFLPEKLIANAEKKRADFKKRISQFYNEICNQFNGEPVPFLKLIKEPTVEALVDSVMCLLHLINHQKIELWQTYENNKNEVNSENSDNGQNLYIAPIGAYKAK